MKDDNYIMKDYIKRMTPTEVKDVMKMRLHMAKLKCNYESSQTATCELCGEAQNIQTEHYFDKC